MAEKTCPSREKRASNWTKSDKHLAAELILAQEDALYGLLNDGKTKETRKKSWEGVAAAFNAKVKEKRSADQLKRCFGSMRTSAAKHIAAMNRIPIPTPAVQLVIDKLQRMSEPTVPLDTQDPEMCTPPENVKKEEYVPPQLPNGASETEMTSDDGLRPSSSMDSTSSAQDHIVEERSTDHRRHKPQGKKRSLEDTLLQCKIDGANLEAAKLQLEMEHMIEKRSEEKRIFELQQRNLKLNSKLLDQKL